MNDLISRCALLADIGESVVFSGRSGETSAEMRGAHKVVDRIKAAPTIEQPTWISVDERLPTETGMYRVCHKSKLIADRYFYSDAPEMFVKFGNDPITHWKPIEEPPKGVE